MAWSETQQVAIAIILKFSASLSLLGSPCIIVERLFVDHRKLGRVIIDSSFACHLRRD